MRFAPIKTRQSRWMQLWLHLLALVAILIAEVLQATVFGSLWPLDLRFSALIAAAGLAVQAIAWWPAALGFAAVAALLPRVGWRVAFWPVAVMVMAMLHGALGPRLGFVPLATLGATGTLFLYTLPTALPILAGSALRGALPTRGPVGACSATAATSTQRTPA